MPDPGEPNRVEMTRRSFITVTGVGTVALWAGLRGLGAPVMAATAPGSLLSARDIPKFRTPLLVPPVMPRRRRRLGPGRYRDEYEIAVRQFAQQILPVGLPTTTVWGYGALTGSGNPRIFNAPSLTIEATHGIPTRIRWVNQLVDANGDYLPHLLPVDPTLHWANPPGGAEHRDSRPRFETTPGRYTGPVPMVTHVHGAVGVGDESDGYAEAWYLPDARNIPPGYATEGTWFGFFRRKAARRHGVGWGRGHATFQYPNSQRASTIWYHDHALGMTRLNVYAGPAGFYLVRGGRDDVVIDSRSGAGAVLPGPAPALGDPPGRAYREIPVAIQDRSFNADGSLFYPDTREFFDGVRPPYLPASDVSPIWNPEFFGNTLIVNGATWPYLDVERRRYRFRFLNGCQARFLILDFRGIPGVSVWQVGNEGGFLAAPVDVGGRLGGQLLMSPAERADVIVDFSGVPEGEYVLRNAGPDSPFGGLPIERGDRADPETTGQVMQFRVRRATSADRTTPPGFMRLPAIAPVRGGRSRHLALIEEMSMTAEDAPVEAKLGTVTGNPVVAPARTRAREWMDPITENPWTGSTEVWEFHNTTGDAHPMHVHGVFFQVVSRQRIIVDERAGTVRVAPGSAPVPPTPGERGWKDTVTAYPGQVTRVRMRFDEPGQFVWHCHIVEHEDNEMMRPFRVGPKQRREPAPRMHPPGM